MKELFLSILEASFHGSIVILAVLLLRQLLKKAPRSLFCLLWLLAGLRLMLPVEIESNFSLQPQLEPVALYQTVAIPTPENVPVVTVPEISGAEAETQPIVNPPSSTYEDTEVSAPVHGAEDTMSASMDWEALAAWVWLAGVGLLCLGSFVSYRKLKRRVREACRMEEGWWECPGLDTAFVLGFLPPRVYLPAGLSEADRALILRHENTHIARRDHWWKLLGYLVLSVHWFNPLVWLAYSMLCRDIELACDERVVKHMDAAQRKAYSNALLSCASSHRAIAACPVAFGETSVKERILSVLHYKKPGFWVCLLAVIAVVFVVLCLMTSPSGEPDLSFLNYENAVSLAAETADVTTIYCDEDSICPTVVSGSALAEYLDSVSWRERRTVPSDLSSPGSIEFVIEEDYRITVFDRNFARVQYCGDVRYYRTGWGDYEEALALLASGQMGNDAVSQCIAAFNTLKNNDSFYVTEQSGGSVPTHIWVSGENFYSHAEGDYWDHLYYNGGAYIRLSEWDVENYPGLSAGWNQFNALPQGLLSTVSAVARPQLPWELYDWDQLDYVYLSHEMADGNTEVHFSAPVPEPSQDGTRVPVSCQVTLTLDAAGALVRMDEVYEVVDQNGDPVPGEWKNTTEILSRDPDDVAETIESVYGQLPPEICVGLPLASQAYLEECRQALEVLQARATYHFTESSSYYQNGQADETETEYWYDAAFWGEQISWLRQSSVSGTELYLYDNLFRKETETSGWTSVDSTDAVCTTWLHGIRWDAQEITFQQAVDTGSGKTVTVTIHAAPPVSGWEAAAVYTVQFTLDGAGVLTDALMRCENGSISMRSEIRVRDTADIGVREKIQGTYATLPTDIFLTIPRTPEEYAQECRESLEAFQALSTRSLMIEWSFRGNAVLNDSATTFWYEDGDDWMEQTLITEPGWEDQWLYLEKDGRTYSRETHTEQDPDSVQDTGWEAGFQGAEITPPWLLTFRWEDQEMTFLSHETEGRYELISFAVQSGEPGISDRQVTFYLGSDRQLKKVVTSYTGLQTGTSSSTATYYTAVMTLHAIAPEDVPTVIGSYAQAAASELSP